MKFLKIKRYSELYSKSDNSSRENFISCKGLISKRASNVLSVLRYPVMQVKIMRFLKKLYNFLLIQPYNDIDAESSLSH